MIDFVNHAKSLIPPACMVEDRDLLVNKNKQATFTKMMTERNLGSVCSELSEWCHSIRNAKAKGLSVPRNDEFAIARMQGKRCCGAHAVLVALDAKAMPQEMSELKAYVKALQIRLKRKGIGEGHGLIALPTHFQEVINAIKQTGSAAPSDQMDDQAGGE